MINPKRARLVDPLERDEKLEPNSTRARVLDMVGTGKRVLEFGCAAGDLSELLTAAGNRVTGVETAGIPADAEVARAACEEVVAADLDGPPLSGLLPGRTFDVVLFDNVLDCVRDPWRLLEEARRFFAPGGYAVLSVSNVAHGSIRLALLHGEFELQNGGPQGRSYVRFFTLKSIHELCFRAGFRVVEIERTKSPVLPSDGSAEILREIETDPEHDTVQFVVRAVPLADQERLAALVQIAVEAELRQNDARFQLERLAGQFDDFRRRTGELEERAAREASERAASDEEVGALRARLERAERDVVASGTSKAEASALRAAVEVAAQEFARAHDAVARERAAFEVEMDALRQSVADWQQRFEEARGAAAEANRERDVMFAEREAAEAARRRMQNEWNEANEAADRHAAAIEDLRFELEREAATLRDVLADRERIREAHDGQQSAAAAFFAHVEAELARTHREVLHLDAMIRQVQSSKWWLLKRALGKARRLVVAKLRR